jgi:hypothetical protein
MTPPDYAISQSATSLHGSLQHLYGLKPSREVFAEQAIKLVAKAAGVERAALLGTDSRATALHPLASVGLPPAAIKILVGRGGRWVGLRCLNERRLSVIAAAHENPFVPSQLIGTLNATRLAVAAIPFYCRDTPVGVALLFAADAHTFSDAVLYTVGQALRVCGTALAELSSSAADALAKPRRVQRPAAPTAFDLSGRAAAPEKIDAASASALLEGERKRIAELEGELRSLREAGNRLPALQAEVDRLNQQAREARLAAEAAKARAAQLEAQRVEAEKKAQAANAILEALVAAQDESEERLEESLVVARQRSSFIAQIEDRLREISHFAARSHQLQEALASSEAARARMDEELARLREEFSASQAERIEIQAALQERTDALSAVQAETRELRTQIDAARTDAEAGRVARAEVAELRAQLEAARAEVARLMGELNSARHSLSEQARDAAVVVRTLTERAAALEAERDRLQAELTQVRGELDDTSVRLRSQIESDRSERQEMARHIAALADAEARRARFQERLQVLERMLSTTALASGTDANRLALEHELREAFSAEASECIESCEQLLNMLERHPDDHALRAALFRRFHLLKEAAATLGSFTARAAS